MILKEIQKIKEHPSLAASKANKKKRYPIRPPFVCPMCNDVWQPSNGYHVKDKLEDFPRFGCGPNICPSCR